MLDAGLPLVQCLEILGEQQDHPAFGQMLIKVRSDVEGGASLAEAMLLAGGAINRLGKVEDGNTVSDYEPEEIDRLSSIQMAVIPCERSGVKLNILDSPGYADFRVFSGYRMWGWEMHTP